MRTDKVNWITAHNYGKPKYHSFSPNLSCKGKILVLDIVSQNVPYKKQTTEPKLLILVSFFSGEVTSYTDISYCIHILWEVCRSIFSGPPCIIWGPDLIFEGQHTLYHISLMQSNADLNSHILNWLQSYMEQGPGHGFDFVKDIRCRFAPLLWQGDGIVGPPPQLSCDGGLDLHGI